MGFVLSLLSSNAFADFEPPHQTEQHLIAERDRLNKDLEQAHGYVLPSPPFDRTR